MKLADLILNADVFPQYVRNLERGLKPDEVAGRPLTVSQYVRNLERGLKLGSPKTVLDSGTQYVRNLERGLKHF